MIYAVYRVCFVNLIRWIKCNMLLKSSTMT